MKSFSNKVVAVTGAASGIGRALAVDLAGRGADLALSDIDEGGLAETASRARARGVEVTTARLDVADRDAVFAWADQVVADHGRANVIVNNAGVALAATVSQMRIEDFEWLMGINLWGVVHGTQAFLPHLRASGEGHVVNISSVFGLVGIPSQSAYNAAKFGVRGFTEALRIELDLEGGPVSCTCVHPGGIKTNIARRARFDLSANELSAGVAEMHEQFDRLAVTRPEKAARQILAAVEQDKRRALIGPDAWFFDVLPRLPVRVYQRAIVRGARRRNAQG